MATDIQWGWAGHTMVDLRWDQIDSTRQACTLGGAKKGSPATRAGAAAELGFKCHPHISITTSRDRIVIAAWV